MPAGSLLAALLLTTSAADPPEVDVGVEAVYTFRISAIGFRTRTEGLFADHGGHLFRTSDGGQSWVRDNKLEAALLPGAQHGFTGEPWNAYPKGHSFITDIIWFDERVGLLVGYRAPWLNRSEDGGATWTRVETPHGQWVYAFDRFGDHLWMCGSDGAISISSDLGRTWRDVASPFERTDVVSRNRRPDFCAGLSFLSPTTGFAVGSTGTYWKTINGGEDWERIGSVLPASSRPFNDILGLAVITENVAWTSGRAGDFKTLDGGRSWQRVQVTRRDERVPVLHPLGEERRAVAVTAGTEQKSPKGIEVLLHRGLLPWGPDGVASDSFEFFERGALVRRGPPMSPPSGQRLQLEATTSREGWTIGWAGRLLFLSDDDGRNWYRGGEAPEEIAKGVILNRRTVLAKSKDGRLLRSDSGGATWKIASDPSTRQDWHIATGEPLEGAATPDDLRCLITARDGFLKVAFSVGGCFGGASNVLTLRIEDGSASLSASIGSRKNRSRIVDVALNTDEASRIIQSIADAVSKPERPNGCWSTNTYWATVTWFCSKSGNGERVAFESRDCATHARTDVVGASTSAGFASDDAYARAIGVYETASSIVTEHSR
jgi:photosystem II stability/assembly factor-like uncharacterized protein